MFQSTHLSSAPSDSPQSTHPSNVVFTSPTKKRGFSLNLNRNRYSLPLTSMKAESNPKLTSINTFTIKDFSSKEKKTHPVWSRPSYKGSTPPRNHPYNQWHPHVPTFQISPSEQVDSFDTLNTRTPIITIVAPTRGPTICLIQPPGKLKWNPCRSIALPCIPVFSCFCMSCPFVWQ